MQPGEVVGHKYRLERLLGEGGMGAVYLAINEKLQKRVALKVLRPEVARMPQSAERMTREAIAASRARHPGIVEIYDADTTDGVTWIAMELLEGESLGERMRRERLGYGESIAIVCEALDALDAVHRHGVIHRDLKPDNLFLARMPDGARRVKVLDFGIAASTSAELARVTQTGMMLGTPAYFAPEQASGERELDARVDVYAMGTILFELLTGQLPYAADSVGALVREMFTRGPPPLSAIDPSAPAALSEALASCLAVNRDQRTPSAVAMRQALQAIHALATGPVSAMPPVAQLAPRPPPPVAPSPPAHARPRAPAPAPGGARWLILAGLTAVAAVVTAAAIGTAVYFARRPASEPVASAEPVAAAPAAVVDPLPVPPTPAVEPEPEPTPEVTEPEAEAAVVDPVRAAADEPRARRRRRRRAPEPSPRVTPPPRPEPPPEPSPAAAEPRPIPNHVWVEVLQRHEAQLEACYEGHFTTPPRPRVSTQVTMQVNTRGAVTSAAVAGGPRPLARCLEGVLRRTRFPTNPWPSRGTFRMTLTDD